MANFQTTYPAVSPFGAVGMIADGETSNRTSRTIVDAAGIGIGVPVFKGPNGYDITATPTDGAFVGITIGSYAGNSDRHRQYSKIGVLTSGEIWVATAGAVAKGDQAYITSGGVITNVSSGNIILPGWTFVDTISSAGISRLASSVSQGGVLPYLGQVATRSYIPDNFSSAQKEQMCQTEHEARDGISSISLVYGGWHRSSASAEANVGADTSITTSVSLSVNGPWTRVTWGGFTTGVILNGLTAVSDSVPFAVPKGSVFYVRSWRHCDAGIVYCQYIKRSLDVLYAGTTTADLTAGGAMSGGLGGLHSPPLAIIGMTNQATVFVIGDSRGYGYNDAVDAAGEVGEVCRSIGPAFAYINASKPQIATSQFLSSSSRTLDLVKYCSHVISQVGVNAFVNQAKTVAAAQADLQSLWTLLPAGKPIFATTLSPYTTGSAGAGPSAPDGSDQTVPAGDKVNALNAIFRGPLISGLSGVFDTGAAVQLAGQPSKWGVGYNSETSGAFIHANQAGMLAIKNSGAIDLSKIHRP